MSTPTRFPGGLNTSAVATALGMMGQLDLTKYHTLFTDFDVYTATDWTVTETQAGATQALTSGDGGLLLLTNSAADDDINAITWALTSFVVDTTKRLFFKCRLKVSDVLEAEVLVGLVNVMTLFNPANGIYIYKGDGAIPLRLSVENAGVTTDSSSVSSVTSAANDTFIDLAFAFDPNQQRVTAWVNDEMFASIADLTNLPTVALAPAVGIRNGEAVAKTMTVDYIFAAKER